MDSITDRSEYRRAVREFLNRTRSSLAACYAASPLQKPEMPERRQEIVPNDIPTIRGQLAHAVGLLDDTLVRHEIYQRATSGNGKAEMEDWRDFLDSQMRNLHGRMSSAKNEVASELAKLAEGCLDNAHEAIVSAIEGNLPSSLIVAALSASQAKEKLCAGLKPVFHDMDVRISQDLGPIYASRYPTIARDIKNLVNYLVQEEEKRLNSSCCSILRNIWEKVPVGVPLSRGTADCDCFSACLTDENNAWVPWLIISYDPFHTKREAAEHNWKKVAPQVKETADRLLREAWEAGPIASLQQSLAQTERWVELSKAAMGAAPVKKQRQAALESSLKEVAAVQARGTELLALHDEQPQLGADEQALHAFLRSCEGSFAAMGEAMVVFSSAVKGAIVERLPNGDTSNPTVMNMLMRDLLSPSHLCGYLFPTLNLIRIVGTLLQKSYENVPENVAHKAVVLDWRGLGAAIFALPEYAGYRKAVADAVELLLQRFDTLEFCSPAAITPADVQTTDDKAQKAWEEYWVAIAPGGVLNAPLKEVLQSVATACDRALDDVWALERRHMEREFTWNPVSQYNFYYDPQENT